jgi:repressor LexA
LGTIPAGHPLPGEEGDLGNLVMDLSPLGIPTTSQTFALRVEGDSMIGAGINDGDVVILEKRREQTGDIVAALLDGEVTLKRYVVEAGKHLLRAANPRFKDIPLNEEAVVQGVAVGLIRKL